MSVADGESSKQHNLGSKQHNLGSKRQSLQAVKLSQRTQAAVQIVSNLPAPSNGDPIYRFLGMPVMRTRWMAGAAAHKAGDVETNPDPTTLIKQTSMDL